MKKLLIHTFAILLSTLMLLETTGVYLTKDICEPCGESEIIAQIVITELDIKNNIEHHSCDSQIHTNECCSHQTHCVHNTLNHQHHQEHHFYKNVSVFLSQNNTPNTDVQIVKWLAPLATLLLQDNTSNKATNADYTFKPKIPQDKRLPLFCTYLI